MKTEMKALKMSNPNLLNVFCKYVDKTIEVTYTLAHFIACTQS